MAFDALPDVDEKALLTVLVKLRDVRAWAVKEEIGPWAFRQGMILVMAMDTECALEGGVEAETLFKFDELAEEKAGEFLESIPKELKGQVLGGSP